MGRRSGICQDWLLPCLDTLFTAITRACNCDVDIVRQPEYVSSPGYTYVPDNGEAICLSCGETVNPRMLTAKHYSSRIDRSYPATTQPEANRGDRIPLPAFKYNPTPEPAKVGQFEWHSQPVNDPDVPLSCRRFCRTHGGLSAPTLLMEVPAVRHLAAWRLSNPFAIAVTTSLSSLLSA